MDEASFIHVAHSKSGAVAKIHPFGATVVSYVTSQKIELLFLSRLAKLDGTKAIRGGIPLVFPQFGQPDTRMPQHGFLRTNLWLVDESSRYDTEDAAGIRLVLPLDKAISSRGGNWSRQDTIYDCVASLSIEVKPSSLTTTLKIDNTSSEPFDFQALLHTYYLVENALSPETCNVKGLEGYHVDDKITNEQYVLGNDPIIVKDVTVDRVYTPPSDKPNVSVEIQTGTSKKIQLSASGQVDGKEVPVSAVVWNPHAAKAASMSDFGDEQYTQMICVEPGILLPTACSHRAELTQTLTAM